MDEFNENELSSGEQTKRNILRASYQPLELSYFSKRTQENFKKIAGMGLMSDLKELKNEAAKNSLYHMLRCDKPQIEADPVLLKEHKKDMEIIEAFIEKAPIRISNEENEEYYYLFNDGSVMEVYFLAPTPTIFNNVYSYLFQYAPLFLKFDAQIDETGHAFLANLGVKINRISSDEVYFEYSKKFVEGLFEAKFFKFVE